MCFFRRQIVAEHLQVNEPTHEQVAVLEVDPRPFLRGVLDHLRGLGTLALAQRERLDFFVKFHLRAEDVEGFCWITTFREDEDERC